MPHFFSSTTSNLERTIASNRPSLVTTSNSSFTVFMAGTTTCSSPHRIGSAVVELTRTSRTGAPFSVRISTQDHGLSTCCKERAEGPSCVYVGPLETASKETLEALYLQARDAYYSGKPLIVDDMFDKVELKLRWYRSKSVVKYPRCSLRRHSAYADAEEDLSLVLALGSIWMLVLAFGSSACALPLIYFVDIVYQKVYSLGLSYSTHLSTFELLANFNGILLMVLGCIIGYPVASASVKVLHGLWRNDIVAMKGVCPNCGEEVFAFVKAVSTNDSPHRVNCHVCECLLEFQTKVEQSISRLGRQWVYGRIYLVSRKGRYQRKRSL